MKISNHVVLEKSEFQHSAESIFLLLIACGHHRPGYSESLCFFLVPQEPEWRKNYQKVEKIFKSFLSIIFQIDS